MFPCVCVCASDDSKEVGETLNLIVAVGVCEMFNVLCESGVYVQQMIHTRRV